MRTLLVAGISMFASPQIASARTFKDVSELGHVFKAKGINGTFVLLDREADTIRLWNEARAKERFTPASTFKIANSLIGTSAP